MNHTQERMNKAKYNEHLFEKVTINPDIPILVPVDQKVPSQRILIREPYIPNNQKQI